MENTNSFEGVLVLKRGWKKGLASVLSSELVCASHGNQCSQWWDIGILGLPIAVVLKGYLINTCIRLFLYNIMKDSVRNIDDFPSTVGPLVSKTPFF